MLQNILKLQPKELGQKLLVDKLKYKKYFRKTSLKQKGVGDFFLNLVSQKNPKTFLEVGVFQGVTARNVCELMSKNRDNDFNYIGLDLFESSDEATNEVVPKNFFSNPFKTFYFKYILKLNPYSKEAVHKLLKKFEKNVTLIKGNSNSVLRNIKQSEIDYVFLDGGHDYKTVKNDLNFCKKIIENNGTILCDDYDLSYAPSEKKAIDEFINENSFTLELLWNSRFAKIEK